MTKTHCRLNQSATRVCLIKYATTSWIGCFDKHQSATRVYLIKYATTSLIGCFDKHQSATRVYMIKYATTSLIGTTTQSKPIDRSKIRLELSCICRLVTNKANVDRGVRHFAQLYRIGCKVSVFSNGRVAKFH